MELLMYIYIYMYICDFCVFRVSQCVNDITHSKSPMACACPVTATASMSVCPYVCAFINCFIITHAPV